MWDLAGKTTRTRSQTNLILGSTECKNVVGAATNWLMGLAVALAINRSTLSAPSTPLGSRSTHFSTPPPLPPPPPSSADDLARRLRLPDESKLLFGKTRGLGFRQLGRKLPAGERLRRGVCGRGAKGAVRNAQLVQFMDGEGEFERF